MFVDLGAAASARPDARSRFIASRSQGHEARTSKIKIPAVKITGDASSPFYLPPAAAIDAESTPAAASAPRPDACLSTTTEMTTDGPMMPMPMTPVRSIGMFDEMALPMSKVSPTSSDDEVSAALGLDLPPLAAEDDELGDFLLEWL